MKIDHWAKPLTNLEGKLLGIELESRVDSDGVRVLAGMEDEVLHEQHRLIERKADWFIENNLYCILSGTASTQEYLPFVRYMTTSARTNDSQWLDDVGGHACTAIPLVSGDFEVARLNRRFIQEHIGNPIFPILIRNIKQYCDKVIVPVQDRNHHQMLRAEGIWAVQGEYKSIRFEHCEKML